MAKLRGRGRDVWGAVSLPAIDRRGETTALGEGACRAHAGRTLAKLEARRVVVSDAVTGRGAGTPWGDEVGEQWGATNRLQGARARLRMGVEMTTSGVVFVHRHLLSSQHLPPLWNKKMSALGCHTPSANSNALLPPLSRPRQAGSPCLAEHPTITARKGGSKQAVMWNPDATNWASCGGRYLPR